MAMLEGKATGASPLPITLPARPGPTTMNTDVFDPLIAEQLPKPRLIRDETVDKMGGCVVDSVLKICASTSHLAPYEAASVLCHAGVYRIYEGTTQILQLHIAKLMLRKWAAQA